MNTSPRLIDPTTSANRSQNRSPIKALAVIQMGNLPYILMDELNSP